MIRKSLPAFHAQEFFEGFADVAHSTKVISESTTEYEDALEFGLPADEVSTEEARQQLKDLHGYMMSNKAARASLVAGLSEVAGRGLIGLPVDVTALNGHTISEKRTSRFAFRDNARFRLVTRVPHAVISSVNPLTNLLSLRSSAMPELATTDARYWTSVVNENTGEPLIAINVRPRDVFDWLALKTFDTRSR